MFKFSALCILALSIQLFQQAELMPAGEEYLLDEAMDLYPYLKNGRFNPFSEMHTNGKSKTIQQYPLQMVAKDKASHLTNEEKHTIDFIVGAHFLDRLKNLYAIKARSRFGK